MKKIYLLLISLIPLSGFTQDVVLEVYASGFQAPVDIANCGDDRLFIVQQNGLIRIIDGDGNVLPNPFLDITALTDNSGEQGLLGLAFHPQYENNGYFFINYIRESDGNTVIARYHSTPGSNTADPLGEQVLVINQPFSNHNGGCLKFGPDGALYIGMGDGGSGGDPQGNGQNKQTLLGKMLRINVDVLPYTIPASNPYADGVDGLPEIYSIGLRNPWKFSIDRATMKIWIADVGQNAWEEVNAESITDNSLNYGWKCYEAEVEYAIAGCDPNANYVSPVHVMNHSGGVCSITGGYVYRGQVNPFWMGKYFFSDYCSNAIYVYNPTSETVQTNTGFSGGFATFGQDSSGELYVAGRNNGNVYKLVSPNASVNSTLHVNVELFPNPSTGVFEIKGDTPILKATVFDVEGRLIQAIDRPTVIRLSDAPKGIYFVNCESDHGQKTIKLVLK